MTTDLSLTEVQKFTDHLIQTAHYVKSHDEQLGYTSTDDMLRQTFEIAYETYDNLKWQTADEELYGKIFDLIEDKLIKILA